MKLRLIDEMDRERFEKFAKEYRPTAAEAARRIVRDNDAAEDITQEVFLKLWNIRESLGRYRSPQSLVAVMARNMAVDYIRRNQMQSLSLDAAEQQSILRMRHIEGMETTVIARTIGSSEGAVRVALSRARQRIKELFLNQQDI